MIATRKEGDTMDFTGKVCIVTGAGGGNIVNFASISGMTGYKYETAYGGTNLVEQQNKA